MQQAERNRFPTARSMRRLTAVWSGSTVDFRRTVRTRMISKTRLMPLVIGLSFLAS